jgi:hypothetical protein
MKWISEKTYTQNNETDTPNNHGRPDMRPQSGRWHGPFFPRGNLGDPSALATTNQEKAQETLDLPSNPQEQTKTEQLALDSLGLNYNPYHYYRDILEQHQEERNQLHKRHEHEIKSIIERRDKDLIQFHKYLKDKDLSFQECLNLQCELYKQWKKVEITFSRRHSREKQAMTKRHEQEMPELQRVYKQYNQIEDGMLDQKIKLQTVKEAANKDIKQNNQGTIKKSESTPVEDIMFDPGSEEDLLEKTIERSINLSNE